MQTVITYLVDFVVLFLCIMKHEHIHPTSVASSRANSTPIMGPNNTVWLSGGVLVGWIYTGYKFSALAQGRRVQTCEICYREGCSRECIVRVIVYKDCGKLTVAVLTFTGIVCRL